MKSSFRKLDKAGSANRAVFGHSDLDAIVGPLAKGHVMVLEEDHPTAHHRSLLRYFVAHGYHRRVPTLIYDANPHRWSRLVAPLRSPEKAPKQPQKSEIAWRYNCMETTEATLSEEPQFLDLERCVEAIDEKLIIAAEYPNCPIEGFYKRIETDFVDSQTDGSDTANRKILISSMPPHCYNSPNIREFLSALRAMMRSSHATTLISLPPIIGAEVRAVFLLHCDFYFQIGRVSEQYGDFSATLTVLKEVQTGQLSANRGVTVWGIANRNREMRILPLYESAVGVSFVPTDSAANTSISF
jgi:hypothetical protein